MGIFADEARKSKSKSKSKLSTVNIPFALINQKQIEEIAKNGEIMDDTESNQKKVRKGKHMFFHHRHCRHLVVFMSASDWMLFSRIIITDQMRMRVKKYEVGREGHRNRKRTMIFFVGKLLMLFM